MFACASLELSLVFPWEQTSQFNIRFFHPPTHLSHHSFIHSFIHYQPGAGEKKFTTAHLRIYGQNTHNDNLPAISLMLDHHSQGVLLCSTQMSLTFFLKNGFIKGSWNSPSFIYSL